MLNVYINGKITPLKKAKISVLDRGLLYGDGAFETMRSYKGNILGLNEHLCRLFRTLKKLGIKTSASKNQIKSKLFNLIKKNNLDSKDAYIKILVTRGASEGLPGTLKKRSTSLVIYAMPHKHTDTSFYKRGVKLGIVDKRDLEVSNISGYKTLNYLSNILYRLEAKKEGCFDMILTDQKGFIKETTSSNIFIVKRKSIATPYLKSKCLPGITRREVIYLAKKYLKCKINEKAVSRRMLYSLDEVFITNSTLGIVPVIKIGNRKIGGGKPGKVTTELMKELNKKVLIG